MLSIECKPLYSSIQMYLFNILNIEKSKLDMNRSTSEIKREA